MQKNFLLLSQQQVVFLLIVCNVWCVVVIVTIYGVCVAWKVLPSINIYHQSF